MHKLFKLLLLGTIFPVLAIQSAFATQVHVTLTKAGTNFSYAVFNDEPTNSTLHLDAFHLVVNAPFDVVSSPAGWSFETDNLTYVDWFSSSSLPPYGNDIAPNSSKSGFVIGNKLPPELPSTSESLSYALSSWDHATTNSGQSATGAIEAPSITTVAAVFSQASVSNATFRSELLGISTYSYAIYSSTNLASWSLLKTNSAPFTIMETNTTAVPSKFYRAEFVPTVSPLEPD